MENISLEEITKILDNHLKDLPQPCGKGPCINKEARTCFTCSLANRIVTYIGEKENVKKTD